MSDLFTLLPPSASSSARAVETVMAERTAGLETPVGTLWNADSCPEELLPWLAWAFSVETWDHAWSEDTKRSVIRSAVKVHRLKGTRQSVEMALTALGFRTDLTEGWQEGGAAHTFRLDAYGDDVVAAGHALNAQLLETVSRLIENVKPVRSHFTLRLGQSFHTPAQARLGVRGRQLIADLAIPAAPAKISATAARLRFAAKGKAAIRGEAKPAAPARNSQTASAARLAVTGRAIIRDSITIRVPEGASYAA